MSVFELNLDGLVGPSHHYAGLAFGNRASLSHARTVSNPAAAAHQGISKMRCLHELGIKQAVLPPHARPNCLLLKQLGFVGAPHQQLMRAFHEAPELLSACYSASSMWTANAATVSSSADTTDQRVHFTSANLISHLHRHQEAVFSSHLLQTLFADPRYFKHHPALPSTMILRDEGAANHMRLCEQHASPGLSIFVYDQQTLPAGNDHPKPIRFPARQTLEASQAIARQHQLTPNNTFFVCQNPKVVDEGVFHNDVIAVSNESLLLVHEAAFLNQKAFLSDLIAQSPFPIQIVEIKDHALTVAEAVETYFFNSQLVTLLNNTMAIIAPTECENHPKIQTLFQEIRTSTPIKTVYYLSLKQSMQNGGGPACLRLRVLLQEEELMAMHQGVIVDLDLLTRLDQWVDTHYRTSLLFEDLVDPALMQECYNALDALTGILKLGSIYPFQRV